MKELLLVHLPDKPLDGSAEVFTPPLGLWSMRSNSGGLSVRVLDMGVEDLLSQKAEAVGYSLQFPGHERFLPAARTFIKARREFLGGPTGGRLSVSGMTSVPGPGENWLLGNSTPFSLLSPPRFETREMEPYWKLGKPFSGVPSSNRWMPVETSRGCPNECGFCAIPRLWGRWQARPLEALENYFRYLLESHGIEEIIVVDDNAAAQKERFLALVKLFKRFSLRWSLANGIYNRTLLDREVLREITGSGCIYLSLPFEAGNPRSAELMSLGRKYLSKFEALQLTEILSSLGIQTAGQFIIGYPGETEAEVAETLSYANSLFLDQRHVHLAMPLPGTPMHRTCEEKGWLVADPASASYKMPVIETPFLSRVRLLEIWKEDRLAALGRKSEEIE